MQPNVTRRAFLGSLFAAGLAVLSRNAEAVNTTKLQIVQVKLKGGTHRMAGESIDLVVKVKNLGGASAGNMQLTVLLEGEKKKKDGSVDFGAPRAVGKPKKVPMPTPGQTATVELTFLAPPLRAVDTGKQKVRVRFTGGPKEGSEAHATFTVKPKEKPEKPEKKPAEKPHKAPEHKAPEKGDKPPAEKKEPPRKG